MPRRLARGRGHRYRPPGGGRPAPSASSYRRARTLLGWAVARTTLFVYGTLLRGETNHHRLAARAEFLGPARTAHAFSLVELGRYPALARGGTTSVEGELYGVDDALRDELDVFEGHPSVYCRETIELDDGRTAEAYVNPRRAAGLPVIEGGSFRVWSKRAVIAFVTLVAIVGHARAERHRDAGSDARAAASASASASAAP